MHKDLIYFAYGSNMSLPRLQQRIPECRKLSVATIVEHQLCFHKVGQDGSAKCDAYWTGNRNHQVQGVLYRLSPPEQKVLDGYEGLGMGYLRKEVETRMLDGQRCTAFLYYATHIEKGLLPFDWYKHHVVSGAIEAGLTPAYIERLSGINCQPDPDPLRASQQFSLYRTKK